MESSNDNAPIPKKQLGINDLWVRILCYLVVLAVLVVALFPVPTQDVRKANLTAVSSRGKDIYMSITGANADREPLGLPPLWPKTYLAYTNHLDDVSAKSFKTSSDYFYELYDGPNVDTDKHAPYVNGFDYSKLAGAGVYVCRSNKLDSANNMWIIAANITEKDDDRIPFLITRNVDVKEIERVINHGLKANEFKTRIDLGKGQYRAPFTDKGLVVVFRGGAAWIIKKRNVTLGDIFRNQELPPRDPSKPPIVYLMP